MARRDPICFCGRCATCRHRESNRAYYDRKRRKVKGPGRAWKKGLTKDAYGRYPKRGMASKWKGKGV